jgi:hypothetical protein
VARRNKDYALLGARREAFRSEHRRDPQPGAERTPGTIALNYLYSKFPMEHEGWGASAL